MKILDITQNVIFAKKNRALLAELVRTDFKLKYKGSVLGHAWSLLKPISLFTILYFVFVRFLKFGGDIPHFSVYLFVGIVFWNFFSESTMGAMTSIVSRGDLLRKIKFPKYIIVISGTISALINLGFNLIAVILFALINGVDFRLEILWLIPLIIELYVFSLGIGFFLSASYVKFRDLSPIYELALQAMFYAIPIIYPITMISNGSPTAAQIVMLNPIAQIVQDARYYFVTDQSKRLSDLVSSPYNLIPYFIILIVLIIGVSYFRSRSKYFAEEI
jgi:ABC-2 type transport system permease protein